MLHTNGTPQQGNEMYQAGHEDADFTVSGIDFEVYEDGQEAFTALRQDGDVITIERDRIPAVIDVLIRAYGKLQELGEIPYEGGPITPEIQEAAKLIDAKYRAARTLAIAVHGCNFCPHKAYGLCRETGYQLNPDEAIHEGCPLPKLEN